MRANFQVDNVFTMSPLRLSDDPVALADFFGLLMECPLHGGNPADCQLNHVRVLPLHDRYEWAKGLGVDEANHIRHKCAQCMAAQKEKWRG